MKKACFGALQDLPRLRDLASDHALSVRVSEVSCRPGVVTQHFMFDDAALRRVLNWWPGTGRVYSPMTGEKGKVEDGWAAIDMAARIATGRGQS